MSSDRETETSKLTGAIVEAIPVFTALLAVAVWAGTYYGGLDLGLTANQWYGSGLALLGFGMFVRAGIVFAYPQIAMDHDIGLSGDSMSAEANVNDIYSAQLHAVGTIVLGLICVGIGWIAFTS